MSRRAATSMMSSSTPWPTAMRRHDTRLTQGTRRTASAIWTVAVLVVLLVLPPDVGAAGATTVTTTTSTTPRPATTPTSTATVPTTPAATTQVSPAPGSYCGQTITVAPRGSLGSGSGPPPLAIGDSVLYDAAQPLSYDGFEINAMVCRTMAQGIVWLEQHQRSLPTLVVVALGTNGPVTATQIVQLLGILGPRRLLALVTPHNGNYADVPGLYRAVARANPERIELLDWDAYSAGHPEWFAPDGIHLSGTAGADAYAQLIASALLNAGGPLPSTTPARRARPQRKSRPTSPAHRARRTPPRARHSSGRVFIPLLAALGSLEAISLDLIRA